MQISALLPTSTRTPFVAGETIIREGEAADVMYVIVAGMVDVLAHGARIATLGPEAIVGEMAFLDGATRSATVVAQTDCVLAPIDEAAFAWLLGHTPHFATQLMQAMVGRMRTMTSRLSPAAEPTTGELAGRPPRLRPRWQRASSGRGLEIRWEVEE